MYLWRYGFHMVRFGAKAGSGDEPEENESFRDLTRRADETRFDTDLAQVETDVEDFGDTATESFSSAWSAGEGQSTGALPEGEEEEIPGDRRASRLRNMDRRVSSGQVMGLLALVGLVVAGFFVFDLLDNSNDEGADGGLLDEAFLVAPGQPRNYAEGTAALSVESGWELVDTFLAEGAGSDPTPVDSEAVALPVGVVAAPLVWGERAHVAIIGPGVGANDICAIASLFSANLDVIDIAADGDCGGRFDATGDRIACRTQNVVLLEVWPENPSVVGEQPDAMRVRVRLERSTPGGAIESLRTTVDLDNRLQIGLRELAGAPESRAQITIGEASETCALLDRSDVAVQLL